MQADDAWIFDEINQTLTAKYNVFIISQNITDDKNTNTNPINYWYYTDDSKQSIYTIYPIKSISITISK